MSSEQLGPAGIKSEASSGTWGKGVGKGLRSPGLTREPPGLGEWARGLQKSRLHNTLRPLGQPPAGSLSTEHPWGGPSRQASVTPRGCDHSDFGASEDTKAS